MSYSTVVWLFPIGTCYINIQDTGNSYKFKTLCQKYASVFVLPVAQTRNCRHNYQIFTSSRKTLKMTFFHCYVLHFKNYFFFNEKLLYNAILKLKILAFNHKENYFPKILVYTLWICVKYCSKYRQSCGSSTSLYIWGFHHTSSCYTHENHIRLQLSVHNFLLNICLSDFPVGRS